MEIKRLIKNDPLSKDQFYLDIYPEKRKAPVSNDFQKLKEKYSLKKGFNKGVVSNSSKSLVYNDIYEFNTTKKKEEKGNSCALQ